MFFYDCFSISSILYLEKKKRSKGGKKRMQSWLVVFEVLSNIIGKLQKFPQGSETSFKDTGRIDYDFLKQAGF